tara:strand:+ start:13908 stop:14660 length:753 start_codon:yes stop_codon:yes gene_type:complete
MSLEKIQLPPKSSAGEILSILQEYGVVQINDFFTPEVIKDIDLELTPHFNLLDDKDEAQFHLSSKIVTKESSQMGKVMRISQTAYPLFPSLTAHLAGNLMMSEIIDSFYGPINKKALQIFATHDTRTRDKDWVDGINHNAGVHFDPYQAIKFSTYLTDTTAENGATRVILGSHLEGAIFRSNLKPTMFNGESILDCHSPFRESQYSLDNLVDLEAAAGTLFIFNTDCWHASGELKKTGLERKFVVCHNRG